MKQIQRGFTLIELVMVIVILGVLAAVALPKFVDLSSNAGTAAVNGVAGGISSASSVNYAARAVTTGNGYSIGIANSSYTTCLSAATILLQGGVPANYTVAGTALSTTTSAANTCLVTGPNGQTANATIFSTSQ
jgi:prepilin-type N-terminal cleavage/methylation domain-containing protein